MNSFIKDESLDELKDALEEADKLLEQLFSFEEDHPFLREHLSDARECVEESMEMKDDDMKELREQLEEESHRVGELRFYVRALQDFCRDSHVVLPGFVTNGFSRLCEEDYRQAEQPPAPADGNDALLFRKHPEDSLEEALPW